MKVETYNLFPTTAVRTDCSDFIYPQDHQDMMDSTDMLIENGVYTKNELTPKYQTSLVIFQNDAPAVWQKLKRTFVRACENYLEVTPQFCPQQKSIEFAGCSAWVYKSWKSMEEGQQNPWHHHNPAFLSGVYYIKVPGDPAVGGTEFHDPRTAPALGSQFQSIAGHEYSWIIFPGWLSHKSVLPDSEEPRYVVAANMYATVNGAA